MFEFVLVAVVGEIIEGKRAKKTVERLDFQVPKQREKLKIGDGERRRAVASTGLSVTCTCLNTAAVRLCCFQAAAINWETFLAPATKSPR